MGYTTDFEGKLQIVPQLASIHREYLVAFSETRRMQRNPTIALNLPDPKREAVKLRIGDESCYFVGGSGFGGQDRDLSIKDYNQPPRGQPGLWCQWVPDESGDHLIWNEAEKFYNYVEWLQYLIKHFYQPWGYKLTGVIAWHGEQRSDFGRIVVKENVVTIQKGRGLCGHEGPEREHCSTSPCIAAACALSTEDTLGERKVPCITRYEYDE